MDYISGSEKVLETEFLQNDRDMFCIYQLKPGDDLHYHRWVSYATLCSEGNEVKRENYTLVYTGDLEDGLTLGRIYRRFNIEPPVDFHGHALSMSDIIVFRRAGTVTAHYIDEGFDFVNIPSFI